MQNIRSEIAKMLRRHPESHKGDYGRIFILAGSRGLTGAAHLAGMGAVRAGAGLVTVGCPDAVYNIIARREAEVMVRPFPSTRAGSLSYKALRPILDFAKTQDVLALGPGLSQNPETQKLIRAVLTGCKGEAGLALTLPIVIDADGLNALAGHTPLLQKLSFRAILTPHPGEFVRVFESPARPNGARRKITPGVILRLAPLGVEMRRKAAEVIANKFGIVLVLKGHRTVVAAPKGTVPKRGDSPLYVNSTGNPGMAAGGIGDVLTGMIAALVGRLLKSGTHVNPWGSTPGVHVGQALFDAARYGVYLHGLAGDLAAKKVGQTSLAARDLLEFLPQAFKKVEKAE